MVPRTFEMVTINDLLKKFPVVGIVGARQVGKTTLARAVAERFPGPVSYYDLENPEYLSRLSDPMLSLKGRQGLKKLNQNPY